MSRSNCIRHSMGSTPVGIANRTQIAGLVLSHSRCNEHRTNRLEDARPQPSCIRGIEYGSLSRLIESSYNGRFLRHRFSPKSKSVATQTSLPKRNRVAKEEVSTAWQTKTRQRSVIRGKPKDSPTTKPWPCVKTMLWDAVNRQNAFHPERHASRPRIIR